MIATILTLLAFAALVANFVDNALLREAHKKQLKEKFETWWKNVEHYDKLKLALVCASKANDLLDFTFGKNLISKRGFFRSSVTAACLLLITLAWLGYINSQPFGVTPWKNFRESIDFTLTTASDISSSNNVSTFKVLDVEKIAPELNTSTNKMLVNANSNLFLFTLTTNGIMEINRVYPVGNGKITVLYDREFRADHWTNFLSNSTNPYVMLHDDMDRLSGLVSKFEKPSYFVLYSIFYFVALFAVNAFLFTVSLATCRVMLREIAASGRILSTIALVFTNVVTVLCLCLVLLLIFTVLAVPVFWLLIPVTFVVSSQSLSTLVAYLLAACIGLWIIAGGPAKIVVFIAFLPSFFAALVGAFTLLAVTGRKWFHFLVKEILIRCAEGSPIGFLIATITFISGILVELSHHLHFTAFL